jgi:hypothetical protein
MTIETIPIKSFLVYDQGEEFGQFVGLDIQGSGYTLGDNGNILSLTLTGGGGVPGGADEEFQWNNAGVFSGSPGMVYDSVNNRPRVTNGLAFESGGNIGVLTWTPTTSRTLTLPDATDTLVGRATTDTLTNKTISAANNTLLISDGASGTVQTANGSGEFTGATNVLAGSGFLSIGANPSTIGGLRLANNTLITGRNQPNTADLQMMYVDVGDNLRFWSPTGGAYGNVIFDTPNVTSFIFQDASVYRLILKNASINASQKLGGDGTFQGVPFRFMGTSIAMTTSTVTASAAQYECVYLRLTGTAGTELILPTSEHGTYCIINDSGTGVQCRTSGGTGPVVNNGQTQWIRCDGTDYLGTTPAFTH